MPNEQRLQIEPFRNCALFSSHWLLNRFHSEPEWSECRREAQNALESLFDLWTRESDRVARYGAEAPLEQAFIQPVLEILGWEFIPQTFLQGRSPDYALFHSDDDLNAALAAGRRADAFWQYAAIVADAKAWDVDLDRPMNAQGQREYPPQQIEWYLDRSRLPFGILTNGQNWRLIPRVREPHQPRFQTYYEFDLPALLRDPSSRLMLDEFLYFFLVFRPASFQSTSTRESLIERAMSGSSAYRVGVGEDLRERSIEAVRLATEGFLTFEDNRLNPEQDLPLARHESFVLIYRLLFIMFAEDRGLLPYGTNRLYTGNWSLRRHRDEIAKRLEQIRRGVEDDFSKSRHNILDDLRSLFDLLDRGHARYQVPSYNGGLFNPESHPFLEQMQISDWHLSRTIDQLGRAGDPEVSSNDLFRVDYRDLSIQHLGSIYEGLLELEPRFASTEMLVVAKRTRNRIEERIIPATHPTPDGFEATDIRYECGQVYLQTNKGERRAYGSYYTPDHIVNHIVEKTLGPLCKQISAQLEAEIAALRGGLSENPDDECQQQIEQLKREFDDRVLRLRVLDPAMGSGHFLLRACTYLAEEIATHPYTADSAVEEMAPSESALVYWKRRVAENCLYGVDLNDLAVELAKLAMWLETVAADQPLTFLDHHFRHGNSLFGARIGELGALPSAPSEYSSVFDDTWTDKVPALLDPIGRIQSIPSTELRQVKEKERLLSNLERTRQRFRNVADLWCSDFVLAADERVPTEDYHQLIDEIDRPRRFANALKTPHFQRALTAVKRSDFNPFHWELEFPEVFFGGHAARDRPGFDAVIGNPPYDVLSEKEIGRDLSALKTFIDFGAIYKPSKRGKNNLYKLFICRALDLLADEGYLGFITPMAVLGDDQAAEIRPAMFDAGTMTDMDSFPQKDNPKKRVFPDAKLSTAVFIFHKTQSENADSHSFTCRVHPGRDLDEVSATLKMTREQVPAYDPSNYTIISCDQADFDLATRIMQTGRMRRLRDVAEFFQGEVNETVQKAKGNVTRGESIRFHQFVTRGASICLYVLRSPSQGHDLYLDVDGFLAGASADSKAFHHRHTRVAVQESSPQNNFRRIIAAHVPVGEFCNHKINYTPSHKTLIDERVILGYLNSSIADWYFRLGSTNAAVSHYQLYNLPFPRFAETDSAIGADIVNRVIDELNSLNIDGAILVLNPFIETAPFDRGLVAIICHAVDRITSIETARGEIARTARSALEPSAQPYQDFLDRLFFRLAGLSEEEASGLEVRLAEML